MLLLFKHPKNPLYITFFEAFENEVSRDINFSVTGSVLFEFIN